MGYRSPSRPAPVTASAEPGRASGPPARPYAAKQLPPRPGHPPPIRGAQAGELIEAADRGGLLIVCAPMDILKREWTQARRLIDAGAIGKVAFARVQSSHGGPAAYAWPADPAWFYAEGAGPLLDMGVYGLERVN